MNTEDFQKLLQEKARELYRDMPWRDDTRPYYVLVSELMLQQTQVSRVVPKFEAFIAAFPDETALANAPLSDVLTLWSGLGYNRRAKFLHEAAKKIVHTFSGVFPRNEIDILSLPGVGKNTCGAIRAYAFNEPAIFIETNVRTVYFHHFFPSGDKVSDAEVDALLQQTINHKTPREFYWALMDYGSELKKQGVGAIAQSKHYKKQSPLKGSVREVRGQLLRVLQYESLSEARLRAKTANDERFSPALLGLEQDGLIERTGQQFRLTQ